jgi:cytochrome P450
MATWFNLYSFDVMGDLAFGKSYNMLESGEKHWSLKLLGEGMDPLGFNFPIWFFRLLTAIPGATAGFFKFINYCCQQLDERMKIDKMENPDIMATLLEHHRKNSSHDAAELHMLQGDSRLIIVAGSDTTAATLVHLFYYLARDPSLVQNLREELAPLMEKDGSVPSAKLADAKLLNGIINETLRLHPPVPSGVFRETPPEGIHIKDTFVPGHTTVRMPQWAMARGELHDVCDVFPGLTSGKLAEDIYTDCMSFVPERWFSRPDMIKHKDAFAPFSIGPFGKSPGCHPPSIQP